MLKLLSLFVSLWYIISLTNGKSSSSSAEDISDEEECLLAAQGFRFAWCDALRGNLTHSEWVTEAAKYLDSDIQSSSTFVSAVWNNFNEFTDAASGNVALLLQKVNEPYHVCISSFGSNYQIIDNVDTSGGNDIITIRVPVTKMYQVYAAAGPPGTPPSIARLVEYDMDRYQCKETNSVWKINYYDETQSFFSFLN